MGTYKVMAKINGGTTWAQVGTTNTGKYNVCVCEKVRDCVSVCVSERERMIMI